MEKFSKYENGMGWGRKTFNYVILTYYYCAAISFPDTRSMFLTATGKGGSKTSFTVMSKGLTSLLSPDL